MNVQQLIRHLQECDPEAMVVVDGYEGGLSELTSIQGSTTMSLNANRPGCLGPHEMDGFGATAAVYLSRD